MRPSSDADSTAKSKRMAHCAPSPKTAAFMAGPGWVVVSPEMAARESRDHVIELVTRSDQIE